MAELARQVVEHAQREAPEHVGVAELWIAIGEDVFPGDEGVVKHDRAIELIEARSVDRRTGPRNDRWFAAQDLDTSGVGGQLNHTARSGVVMGGVSGITRMSSA